MNLSIPNEFYFVIHGVINNYEFWEWLNDSLSKNPDFYHDHLHGVVEVYVRMKLWKDWRASVYEYVYSR